MASIEQVRESINLGADVIEKTPTEAIRRDAGLVLTSYALSAASGLQPTLNHIGQQLTDIGHPLTEVSVMGEHALSIWTNALTGSERPEAAELLDNGAELLKGDQSVTALQNGVVSMEAKLLEAQGHYDALCKSLGELADIRNQWNQTVNEFADNAARLTTDARDLADTLVA
jgi:hypothetical protein